MIYSRSVTVTSLSKRAAMSNANALRAEGTVNLLGHAGRQVLACVAQLSQQTVAEVIAAMGLSMFEAPSLKALELANRSAL